MKRNRTILPMVRPHPQPLSLWERGENAPSPPTPRPQGEARKEDCLDAATRIGYSDGMKKILLGATLLALILLPTTAFAQTPTQCKTSYIVKTGDWLSKIAGWYYGDVQQFSK